MLPPRARLLVVRAGGAISGAEVGSCPRFDRLVVSGGGDTALSLIGLTLLDPGLTGEDLRGPRTALPGNGFHFVALEGDGITAGDSRLAVRGVDSNLAMSKGVNEAPDCVER